MTTPSSVSNKVKEENYKQIFALMDIRKKQFEEIYDYKWWENLIKDELYNFLCRKLAELKTLSRPTFILNRELTEEEIEKIKGLASGFITVDDYIKSL